MIRGHCTGLVLRLCLSVTTAMLVCILQVADVAECFTVNFSCPLVNNSFSVTLARSRSFVCLTVCLPVRLTVRLWKLNFQWYVCLSACVLKEIELRFQDSHLHKLVDPWFVQQYYNMLLVTGKGAVFWETFLRQCAKSPLWIYVTNSDQQQKVIGIHSN